MDLAAEVSESTINALKIGYLLGGAICLLLAVTGFGQTTGTRIFNALVGLAMVGYSIYLFASEANEVRVFWYALILPVILLIQAIVAFSKRGRQPAG